jgi:hypothetical protein
MVLFSTPTLARKLSRPLSLTRMYRSVYGMAPTVFFFPRAGGTSHRVADGESHVAVRAGPFPFIFPLTFKYHLYFTLSVSFFLLQGLSPSSYIVCYLSL